MLEIICAFIIGIIAGTFTGLAPGIHINLIAAILVSSISKFPFISPLPAAVFIVAMSITHTFIDFIPSIFLGVPEEDSFLAVLPGHQMLLEGRAHEAIIYTVYGSLSSIITLIIFTPILFQYLDNLYIVMTSFIPLILIFVSCYLILREDNIFLSLFIFLSSGILGVLTFASPVREPLLPMLTGLFGISSLIANFNSSIFKVKQKIPKLKSIFMSKKDFLKAFIPISLITPLVTFLPGISSSHVATISSEIVPQEKKGFLFMLGSVSTTMMALTFITVYTIEKSRSGSAAAVKEILPSVSSQEIWFIILTVITSAIIAFIIAINISKSFSSILSKVNYKYLNLIVIFILFIVNLYFTNMLGILVLITSTALGIFAINSNSRRINLMGCLILPVISYYLF